MSITGISICVMVLPSWHIGAPASVDTESSLPHPSLRLARNKLGNSGRVTRIHETSDSQNSIGRHPSGDAAFTLTELLTVIGIILVMLAIAMPVMGSIRNAARKTQTVTRVQAVFAACQVYALEDRRRMPPPAEIDLTLRTAQGGSMAARTLDLLQDRGLMIDGTQLGLMGATGRSLLDAWRRPLRYQPDIVMDGIIVKPAAKDDWNANAEEPFAYVWSLGKPSGNEAEDTGIAAGWIYVTSTAP